jgi:hypothetical protein
VRWVGVLAGGPDAALCRPSAPELGGLRGFESPVSAKLDPRRTTMPFSVIAMTSKARKVERAHHILASAAQQRLIRTSDVRAALGCRPDVRLRALMPESLIDIDDGAQSLNEIALKRLISRSRLPPAELQIRTATRRRRSRLDGGWPAYGVAFEVDGAGHFEIASWLDDADRHNEVALGQPAGTTMLRWPGFVVRRQPDRVVDQALAGAGPRRMAPGLRRLCIIRAAIAARLVHSSGGAEPVACGA